MKIANATQTAPVLQDQRRIRVVLVDDHPAVRAGLGAILSDDPRIDVVAAAATAAEAFELIEQERPDLAIVDYNLPGEDGVSLCYRLESLPMPPRVLLLSAFADDTLAVMAVVAGADGVMSKGAPIDLHKTAVALVAGETRMPEISPLVLKASGFKLDPEDLPILGMLVHGVPADDIAATLNVTPAWLGVRRWGMLEKLRDRRPRRAGGQPLIRFPSVDTDVVLAR